MMVRAPAMRWSPASPSARHWAAASSSTASCATAPTTRRRNSATRRCPGPMKANGRCFLVSAASRAASSNMSRAPALRATMPRRRARLKGPEIVARARAGEAEAKAAIDRLADRLARLAAAIVNVVDPDIFVIGGGLSGLPGARRGAGPARRPLHFLGRCHDQGRARQAWREERRQRCGTAVELASRSLFLLCRPARMGCITPSPTSGSSRSGRRRR